MGGLIIGLDLNDDYVQISCYDKEKSWTNNCSAAFSVSTMSFGA